MFPFGELERMRETQELALEDTVTIKRRVLTSDGFGGSTTQAPVTVAENIPARVTQAQVQNMGGQAARDLLLEKWTVRLPVGTSVEEEDYIHWGDIVIQVEDVKPRTYNTAVSIMGEVVK